jgi:hypothetical protein
LNDSKGRRCRFRGRGPFGGWVREPSSIDTTIRSHVIKGVYKRVQSGKRRPSNTPNTMNVADKKSKVYHISPQRVWLIPGIITGFGIFMLTLAIFDSSGDNTNLYFGLIVLAFALGMYLLLRHSRLELSADGIKLHQTGYKLETEWDNIAQLYNEPGAEGLILHRPMECRGAFELAKLCNTRFQGNMFNAEQLQFIREQRFIPIYPFAYWLKKGQLRDDLAQRAPQMTLLEKSIPWY